MTEEQGLKPTHMLSTYEYVLNKKTFDALARKYGDVSLTKEAEKQIDLAVNEFFAKGIYHANV